MPDSTVRIRYIKGPIDQNGSGVMALLGTDLVWEVAVHEGFSERWFAWRLRRAARWVAKHHRKLEKALNAS